MHVASPVELACCRENSPCIENSPPASIRGWSQASIQAVHTAGSRPKPASLDAALWRVAVEHAVASQTYEYSQPNGCTILLARVDNDHPNLTGNRPTAEATKKGRDRSRPFVFSSRHAPPRRSIQRPQPWIVQSRLGRGRTMTPGDHFASARLGGVAGHDFTSV